MKSYTAYYNSKIGLIEVIYQGARVTFGSRIVLVYILVEEASKIMISLIIASLMVVHRRLPQKSVTSALLSI